VPQIHVMPRDLKWAVLRDPAGRPDSTHDRLEDAVAAARALARTANASVVIYGLDGRVRRDTGETTRG